ncbi:MAG: glycosyltransferase [Myxococcales bacterium]|nr:glycosyltransferase [Myxococcales bacterium]
MRVSIAVPAYNEERNIGELLDTLRAQRVKRAKIVEVVVVASGCTDRTAEIVRERMSRPGIPVRLIEEPERRGKVAAINAYLRTLHPSVDAICVCSADLLVSREVVERLVQCFLINPEVGMCGGRPVPTNGYGTFTGEATRFLWQMHHRVAMEAPKLGELVMLRAGIVRDLPTESAVDEASIEQLVCNAGYRLAYVPEAVVHNHGPETVRDFIRQRRRIAAGHIWLRSVSGYSVSTMNVWRIARLALSEIDVKKPREALFRFGTIGVEAISRVLGFFDYHTNSTKHAVWKVSETTKRVMTDQVRDLYADDLDDVTALSSSDHVLAQPGRATGT